MVASGERRSHEEIPAGGNRGFVSGRIGSGENLVSCRPRPQTPRGSMRFRFSTLAVLPGATLTGGADNIASEEQFRSKGSVGHSYDPISEKEVSLKARNSIDRDAILLFIR